MASERLRSYIEQTRRAGYSDKEIRKTLLKAGWKESDIDEILGNGKPPLIADPPKPDDPAEKNLDNPFASAAMPMPSEDTRKRNALAVVSFISSFFVPLIPIVLGFIALSQIKNSNEKGRYLAIAGIIISIFLITSLIAVTLSAVIFYIGALSMDPILSEKCLFPAGLDCLSHAPHVTQTETSFELRNNMGNNLKIIGVKSERCSGETYINLVPMALDPTQYAPAASQVIENTARFSLKLTGCSNGAPGMQISDSVIVTINSVDSSLNSEMKGTLWGIVS